MNMSVVILGGGVAVLISTIAIIQKWPLWLTFLVSFAAGNVIGGALLSHAMDKGRTDCPDRDIIVADLTAAGEQRVLVGVKPEGIVMEIYVARNGSWTEIWTWPRGQSCVIAFGNDMAVTPPGEGA